MAEALEPFIKEYTGAELAFSGPEAHNKSVLFDDITEQANKWKVADRVMYAMHELADNVSFGIKNLQDGKVPFDIDTSKAKIRITPEEIVIETANAALVYHADRAVNMAKGRVSYAPFAEGESVLGLANEGAQRKDKQGVPYNNMGRGTREVSDLTPEFKVSAAPYPEAGRNDLRIIEVWARFSDDNNEADIWTKIMEDMFGPGAADDMPMPEDGAKRASIWKPKRDQ